MSRLFMQRRKFKEPHEDYVLGGAVYRQNDDEHVQSTNQTSIHINKSWYIFVGFLSGLILGILFLPKPSPPKPPSNDDLDDVRRS